MKTFKESTWKIPQTYRWTYHENHQRSIRHQTTTVYARRTRKIITKKAAGLDEISPEVLKTRKYPATPNIFRTLTSITAKICNALLLNRIELEIEKILCKIQNGFRRNRSTTSQILTISRILEGVRAINLEATLLFVDFSMVSDRTQRKMEQILLAYGLPKETVAVIMMQYKNTKVKVRSPGGGKDFIDIVAGELQENTLVPYLFIICQSTCYERR